MAARGRRIRLPEALEDVDDEFRLDADADAGVGDADLEVRIDPLETRTTANSKPITTALSSVMRGPSVPDQSLVENRKDGSISASVW